MMRMFITAALALAACPPDTGPADSTDDTNVADTADTTDTADAETEGDDMAVTAFYRSTGQAGDYAESSYGLPSLARHLFDGSGAAAAYISFWVRAAAGADAGGAFVFEAGDDEAPSLRVYYGGNGLLYAILYDDTETLIGSSEVAAALDGEWHHVFVVVTGVATLVYHDGVAGTQAGPGGGTFATTADKVTLFARHDGTFPLAGDVANFSVSSSLPTAGQIADLYAAGVQHDITETTGTWTGVSTTHRSYWSTHADAGNVVANTGLYGGLAYPIPLTFAGGVQSIPFAAETATTAVPRTINKYPPIRTYYRTPGTSGSFLRAPSTSIPRLVFPDGGGLSSFAWRFWIRRPQTPTTTGGTVGVITGGDASVTVTLDATEHLVVTVDDGTNTPVTGTSAEPLSGFTWYEVVIVHDADTDTLTGWLGTEGVVSLDLSGLTFPDADTELTFVIGAEPDGTSPLDGDFTGIAWWDDVLTEDEIIDLVGGGIGMDVRDPAPGGVYDPVDGTSPPSGYTWREEIVDDVIPPAEGDEPLIVIGDVESITDPSSFNIWPMGDHRIGAWSSAWWPESAHDPDLWTLAFDTAAHEDVFGECPRVVVVTPREDGALLLDLDAKMAPGVNYALTAPNDFAGYNPDAATLSDYVSPGGESDYAEASTNVAARILFPGGAIGTFTVLMWAQQDTANGFNFWSCGTFGGDYIYSVAAGRVEQDVEAQDGGVGAGNVYAALPDTDAWAFYALTCDGSTMRGYGDGVEAMNSPVSGTYGAQDVFVLFSSTADTPTVGIAPGMTGSLCNVAIFNRALTADEIAALYAAGRRHDYTFRAAGWAGETPSVYWRDAPSGGLVANAGDGGACDLVLNGDVTGGSD